jgi:hypothetical protein
VHWFWCGMTLAYAYLIVETLDASNPAAVIVVGEATALVLCLFHVDASFPSDPRDLTETAQQASNGEA